MNEENAAAALTALFATVDPVPAEAMAAAYDAFAWRDIDAELAQLTFETAADQTLAHTRGEAPRLLTFTSDGVTIDLEVATEGEAVRLLGQLDPPQTAHVIAEAANESVSIHADARGRFQLDGLPAGRLRVVVTLDETRVATEWFHS
ncbi:MAG TPA: hypothetical protein VGF84_20985 [Micromonosporaceae bacterium]|jgi:hypothetical protein